MTLDELSKVLREYGSAIRGDWGSIDGRSEQFTIESFADAITSPHEYTVEKLRNDADICPHGDGHWTDYCSDTCGEEL